MTRDVVLTVAAAQSRDIVSAVAKPSFALAVVVPKLEVKADVRTSVAIEVVGEAL